MAGICMQKIDIIYMQKWFTWGKDESKTLNRSLSSVDEISFEDSNKDGRDKLIVTER